MILSGVTIIFVFIAFVAATVAVVRSFCRTENGGDEEVQGGGAKQWLRGCETKCNTGCEGKSKIYPLIANGSMTHLYRVDLLIGELV